MSVDRRQMLQMVGASLCAAGLPITARAQRQGFPSQPITIVCPYPPGGSTDQVARIIQEGLSKETGQTVIVENRGGANGSLGSAYVAKSPPDGYKILLGTQPLVTINPYLYPDAGFDPMTELTPITKAVNAVLGLAVHPGLPVHTLEEFVEYAKKNKGKVTYGTSGIGSPQHIGGVQLASRAGIELQHVPYKGGGPAISDTVAGHVDATIVSLSALLPLIPDNRIRVIAIGELERFPGAPDIPTMAETYPGFELTSWLGFFGPSKLPKELVAYHSEHISKALSNEAISKRLREMALPVAAEGPDALAAILKTEYEMYGNIIREHNIAV